MAVYGNTVLREEYGYVDEQMILQEMYFSKKDLQDPKTIEKINKKMNEPLAFKSLRIFIDTLIVIFNIIIAVPTLGIGLLLTLSKSIDIITALKEYYPKKKDKTVIKFREKVSELIKTSEEQLKNETNEKKKQELRQVIQNCKEVEKIFKEKEKQAKDEQYQKYVEGSEKAIKDMISWFESKNNTGYEVYFKKENIFGIGLYAYKIPENVYIDHIIKSYKSESIVGYTNDEDDLENISNKFGNLIPELNKSEIKKDNLINIVGHDDWQVYIGIKSKKIFEIYDTDKIKIISLKDKSICGDDTEIDKYLKAADARLGYYKLSQSPKQIQVKSFPVKF